MTVDVRQPIMDTTMRIAAIMTGANSRLSRLQGEAANAAFTDTSKHINALRNAAKSPAVLTEWPRLYQANAQKMVGVTTIVGTEGGAGNDYVVSIAGALVTTLFLKAGMIAIFTAAGLLLL
jgi:hypothetical protein